MEAVGLAALAARPPGWEPLGGACRATITGVWAKPKQMPPGPDEAYYAKKRHDIDQLQKIVLDALTGIAFLDDGQVCEIRCSKFRGDNPRLEVVVEAFLPE